MIVFQPSPDQVQIVDSIAGFLQRDFPVRRFRPEHGPDKTERTAWRELASQGFFGLAASEDIGGAGFSIVEEMLAQREFGRALVSPSVLATVLGVHVLQEAGRTDLAAGLVQGERPVALGFPRGALALGAVADGVLHLVDSYPGDLILLRSREGLALVERDHLVEIEQVDSLDESVVLHRARADATKTVAINSIDRGPHQRGTLLLASALVGMAEASRDLAVEHAQIREQFGKPIGAFQAVAHHCADMHVRARAARAQTSFAAMALENQRSDAAFHVSAAAIVAADAAVRNATIAIRVLGGMGFTAECGLHLYLKRSHLYERMGGRTRTHQTDILRHDADAIMASD
jgi:alkylation response protein AidB-like acyl-CoA dehydrogenase